MTSDRITASLASAKPVGAQRRWPRYQVDTSAWTEIGRALGTGEAELLGLWGEPDQVHVALRGARSATPCVVSLAVADGSFPSLGRFHPPAIRLERAIHDLYGLTPTGAVDKRKWLDHGAWSIEAPLGAARSVSLGDPSDYAFQSVAGGGLHQIPVGPVHAGIIEPGHFRFTANGETVARLEERLGYVHKGIDGLLVDVELEQAGRVIARGSGDSTVAYGFAFAQAVEAALDFEAPERAQVLRGVMAELERIANHFGDIGAICNDASFALIHAHCGIFREQVLDACDRAFGHRLMMDRIVPGGVAGDISQDAAAMIVASLDRIMPRFAEIVEIYDETPSLQDRTCTTGILAHDLVERWAAGGFVGRASGRDFDTRRDLAYPPYSGMAFNIPIRKTGDVDARVWVRIHEVEQSVILIKRWLAALPGGPIRATQPGIQDVREGIAMVEAFRGDVLVWLRIAKDRVARAHIRDASWFQWPLLEAAIEGNIVADFPLCNKSFNCSYSGHDL